MGPRDHSPSNPNGGRRGRIISTLAEELRRVPFVDTVSLVPTRTGLDYQIRGEVNCDIFLSGQTEAEEARVYINWWTHPSGPDQFKFHYTEESGFDCGYHRQENDHVDGDDHFQWREDEDSEYTYEEVTFDYDLPPGVLWEVVHEKLPKRREELLTDS